MTYDAETGELFEPKTNGHATPIIQPTPPQPPRAVAGSLGIAIQQAKARIGHLVKATADSQFKNKDGTVRKYGDLSDILVVEEILLQHGIRIRSGELANFPCDDGGGKGRLSVVYTDLVYDMTGEYERTTIHVPYSKVDAQGAGSALTYGRRYTLMAALSLAPTEDDEGKSTRRTKITDRVTESSAVAAFKAEIAKQKDMTGLYDWGEKNSAKIAKLSEDEQAALRVAYELKCKEFA